MSRLEDAVEDNRKLRPRTKTLYLQHVRSFILFTGETDRWSSSHVKAWRADMLKRKIRNQSINVALNALRFAAEAGGYSFFPTQLERLPMTKRRGDQADRPLTWAEGKKILAQCAGTRPRDLRDRAIIVLGLRTGALRFALCELAFRDLERPAGAPWKLTLTKKGGDRHTVELDPVTMAYLHPWLDWLAQNEVTTGKLFRSLGRERVRVGSGVPIAKALTPDGLYRSMLERFKAAGITDVSPNTFRITFRTWARAAGASGAQIVAVTGHKSDADGEPIHGPGVPANHLLADFVTSKSPKLHIEGP